MTLFRSGCVPLALLILIASAPLSGGAITVDLSGIVNSDLTTYSDGGNYPAPSLIAVGGIDFQLTAGPNAKTWGGRGRGVDWDPSNLFHYPA
jgi:hypothetical protein